MKPFRSEWFSTFQHLNGTLDLYTLAQENNLPLPPFFSTAAPSTTASSIATSGPLHNRLLHSRPLSSPAAMFGVFRQKVVSGSSSASVSLDLTSSVLLKQESRTSIINEMKMKVEKYNGVWSCRAIRILY
ncbi:hypothetical protein HanRHA438_Chr17g0837941 [Helianthus annuus]|nr:hypothetical protein HanRHA438_Chr17g0837941 [Helianthus annuus]